METRNFGERLLATLREFVQMDLRKSYLVIAALVVVGAVVNMLFVHGWTIWPFIGAAGIMLMINEAAERNGQGIPPIAAYALLGSAILAWAVIVAVLSALNPFILVVGIAAVAYHAARANIRQRERLRLINFRRESGCCIHCGERASADAIFCEHCGEEPNPEVARLHRVAAIARNPGTVARTRQTLSGAYVKADIASKEAALLQKAPPPEQGAPEQKSRREMRLGPASDIDGSHPPLV